MTLFLIIANYVVIAAIIAFVFLLYFTAIVNLISGTPYLPSRKKTIKYVVNLAGLKKGDKVYDLGCGDGRFLIEASKKTGTKPTGYETAPIPYLMAKLKRFFTRTKFNIFMKNFFNVSLKDANVIYCYLTPETMDKLAPKLVKECKKGTRIFTNTFSIKAFTPKKIWKKQNGFPLIYLYEL